MVLPNHILDGDNCPGSLGVSIQKDQADRKSSSASLHFSQSLLYVLTVASAKPLLWAWLTLDLLWAIPLFLSHLVKSPEVRMPSPSHATTMGQVLAWNQFPSLWMTVAELGGDLNLKKVAHPLK